MVKGLSNNGSNCFINTCLQVLLQTHQLNFLHSCSVNNNNETDMFVLDAWKDLVSEYNNQKISVINPGLFIRIIRRCSKIKGNVIFSRNQQNDVSEFLLFMIECFHNSICGPSVMVARKPITKVAGNVWEILNQQTTNYSEINDLFYGISVKEIISPTTRSIKSIKSEQFFILDLPICQTDSVSIYDCFEILTKKELLTGENKWYNEKTKKKEEVEIQNTFFKLPDILVITLGRFSDYSRIKNKQLVTFPLTNLNIQPYCHPESNNHSKYELYAICNHIGNNINSGHYNAYLKSKNNWFICDDENIIPISSQDLCTSDTYCLFYRSIF